MRLVGLDAEVVELDLGLRPGQGRGPLERGRLAVLVGQVEDLLARLGDDRREDRVGGRARREPHAARRLKIGSSTAPTVFDSGRPSMHRDRRADRAAAAEEAGAVGLVLDDPAGLLLDGRDVRGPDRRLVARSAAGGSPAARRCSGRTRSARTGSGRPGGRRRRPAARARSRRTTSARSRGAASRGWSATRGGSRRRPRPRRRSSGRSRSSRRGGRTRRGPRSRRPRSCRPRRRSAGGRPTRPRRCRMSRRKR